MAFLGTAQRERNLGVLYDPVLPQKQQGKILWGKVKGTLTGHSSSVGVPSARKIVLSWSMSVSPGRYGVRSISSAKMQPTDQISTALL